MTAPLEACSVRWLELASPFRRFRWGGPCSDPAEACSGPLGRSWCQESPIRWVEYGRFTPLSFREAPPESRHAWPCTHGPVCRHGLPPIRRIERVPYLPAEAAYHYDALPGVLLCGTRAYAALQQIPVEHVSEHVARLAAGHGKLDTGGTNSQG